MVSAAGRADYATVEPGGRARCGGAIRENGLRRARGNRVPLDRRTDRPWCSSRGHHSASSLLFDLKST
jgi:hypothetical protein